MNWRPVHHMTPGVTGWTADGCVSEPFRNWSLDPRRQESTVTACPVQHHRDKWYKWPVKKYVMYLWPSSRLQAASFAPVKFGPFSQQSTHPFLCLQLMILVVHFQSGLALVKQETAGDCKNSSLWHFYSNGTILYRTCRTQLNMQNTTQMCLKIFEPPELRCCLFILRLSWCKSFKYPHSWWLFKMT